MLRDLKAANSDVWNVVPLYSSRISMYGENLFHLLYGGSSVSRIYTCSSDILSTFSSPLPLDNACP